MSDKLQFVGARLENAIMSAKGAEYDSQGQVLERSEARRRWNNRGKTTEH
ncbi:MAG: hypothetical protein ACREBC_13760 [Pyrinomonadaceae bacterium]